MTDLKKAEDQGDWTTGQRRALLSRCESCGTVWYLPRARCPACRGSRSHRFHSGGNGVCVAATTLHVAARGEDGELVRLCLVELEGGAVAMGRAKPGVRPGALVRLEFSSTEAGLLPTFALRS